jgi:ribosomal protein S21
MYNNYKRYDRFTSMASRGGDFSPDSQSYPSEAVIAQPLEVRVYGNNFEKAIRAFRALVQKERILSIYKEKQTYEKPSDRKRREKNEMKRKLFEAECTEGDCKVQKSSFTKYNSDNFSE